MARKKLYLETSCVDEAERRIEELHDHFDRVVVMFSGGKDSLTCLELIRRVRERLGITEPLDVVFRDEELIPDDVIDFVASYRQLPWLRMLWFCVPLRSHKYVLGRTASYTQWDNGREWLRPKPEWAISLPAGDDRTFDQYTMDQFVCDGYYPRGKIALVTGVRAAESLVRFRSVVNKLPPHNWINVPVEQPDSVRWRLAKPIYDWEENDIMAWLRRNEVRWCPIYDVQNVAGMALRVSTPLHAENSKRFGQWRLMYPTYYAQLVQLFPEMKVQERYYAELDLEKFRARYGTGWDACRNFVAQELDGDEAALGDRYIEFMEKLAANAPEAYDPKDCLKALQSGAFKRRWTAVSKKTR